MPEGANPGIEFCGGECVRINQQVFFAITALIEKLGPETEYPFADADPFLTVRLGANPAKAVQAEGFLFDPILGNDPGREASIRIR